MQLYFDVWVTTPNHQVLKSTKRIPCFGFWKNYFGFERLIIRISLWTPKTIERSIRHDGITTYVRILNRKNKCRHPPTATKEVLAIRTPFAFIRFIQQNSDSFSTLTLFSATFYFSQTPSNTSQITRVFLFKIWGNFTRRTLL